MGLELTAIEKFYINCEPGNGFRLMRTAVSIFVCVTSTKCRPHGGLTFVLKDNVGGPCALTGVVGMTKSWEMKSLKRMDKIDYKCR
jgi:hypothetical protein